MKKIKVLQFPIANSKGGITQYVLQNWKFVDKSKFHFDFATMSKTLDFADRLEQEGCKIYYISCYAENNKEKFVNEFKKILSEEKYDIVHLHTKQWKSFLVEEIAKEADVRKIIVHAHSTGIGIKDEQKREEELQLHKYVLEKLKEDIATDYWACSWKAADFIFGNKIPKQKIKIMNNAIDLSRYVYNLQTRIKYRRKYQIDDNECVIGNVGRFVYEKNQEFLIKVFEKLDKMTKENEKKYKLLLVGSGEREKEYKEIVSKTGLENKVIFAGQRSDVAELLQMMDIFCLPSRFEGLPISIVEAQASGLPCIISNSVTQEAVITKNITLLPLDVDLWIEKIWEYSVIEYRGEDKGMQLLREGYDIRNQIKQIEAEYTRKKIL